MSMLNHSAKKARLTFKLETDELWINTGSVETIRFFFVFMNVISFSRNNKENTNETNSKCY